MLRGGSNIIKENEININDIGSSSDSGDSDDDGMLYFGSPISIDILIVGISNRKIVDYRETKDGIVHRVLINELIGTPDYNQYFFELGLNPNLKTIYSENKWLSPKEFLEKEGFKLEYFKPISKEEFYRTEYTEEEAVKIKQEYEDYINQFAPSETE